jgi:hypothetical protein
MAYIIVLFFPIRVSAVSAECRVHPRHQRPVHDQRLQVVRTRTTPRGYGHAISTISATI